MPDDPPPWSAEETTDARYADERNFYKVEKWTGDGLHVDRLIWAGNSLDRAPGRIRCRCPAPARDRRDDPATGAGAREVAGPVAGRMKRPDWTRPLRRPLVITGLLTLRTIGDVRALLERVPEERRVFATWRVVARAIEEAARGADPAGLEVALLLVLAIERVPCRPARSRRSR